MHGHLNIRWAKKSENPVQRHIFGRNVWEIFRRLGKIVFGGALLRAILAKYWQGDQGL